MNRAVTGFVIKLTLPWPTGALSPNGPHGHWAPHARAKKRYRDTCHMAVLEQRVKAPTAARLDVSLVFVRPERRRYDLDNLIARMKSGLDGIACAWQIDDSAFVRITGEILEGVVPTRRDAEVRVTIAEHARAPLIERGPDGMPSEIRL